MIKKINRGLRAVFLAGFLSGLAYPVLAADRVYIPLGSEGEVLIVDAERDAVTGRISGLPSVHGLAGRPDWHYLVAGSYEEREADLAAPARPPAISVDEHEIHHRRLQGKNVQDISPAVSTVSIIELAEQSVVRRIDVPGAVHHVAISPDGRYAVVTHPNQGLISAIDLQSYEVVAKVATGPLPNYAAFSPDGNEVYVSNAGNNTVSAVATSRWIVRWNALVGGSPEHVVLSDDGALLYVNNVEDGTVSVIATAERDVVKTILIGSTPHGIDLSEDGKTLFVADLGEDKLIAVNLKSGKQKSVSLTPGPYHLAVIRNSGKLYVSSAEEPKIWVIDQKSLTVIGEIPIGGKGHQMVQGAGS